MFGFPWCTCWTPNLECSVDTSQARYARLENSLEKGYHQPSCRESSTTGCANAYTHSEAEPAVASSSASKDEIHERQRHAPRLNSKILISENETYAVFTEKELGTQVSRGKYRTSQTTKSSNFDAGDPSRILLVSL